MTTRLFALLSALLLTALLCGCAGPMSVSVMGSSDPTVIQGR